MPNLAENRGASWIAVAWCILGVFAFFIALAIASNVAMRQVPLWLCADQYMAGELEVTRIDARAGRVRGGRAIDGVIHPGGEKVQALAQNLDLEEFIDPADRKTRFVPLPREIEGKRIGVLYWPDHPSIAQWWHPPTVLNPGATEVRLEIVRNALLAAAFGLGAFVCFQRGGRRLQQVVPAPPPRPATPPWVGIVLVLLYVVVLGLVTYVMPKRFG